MSDSGWVLNASPEVNARSQYPVIIGVCISLCVLMLTIVCLRVYTRLKLVQAFGADDAVIIFAAVCSIIYSGLCITQSRLGLGLTIALRPKEDLVQYTVVNYVGRPFYMAGITGFKVALCIAYLRISKHASLHRYRVWIWLVMAWAILSHLAGTLALILACNPVYKSWQPVIPGTNTPTPGSCLPNGTFFYTLAAVTIFTDIVVLITPIPLLLRLRINLRRKLGLIGIFMLGIFTTVCSVLRMIQIIQISKDGNSTGLVLWGTIEMNVGISLTCLPTLAPLFTFFRSDTATSYRYRSGGSGRGTGGNGGIRSGKRASRLVPTGLTNLSYGGGTAVGTGHARDGGESDGSLETILPLQNPAEPDKMVEDGYILRSVDISVTRGSPGPNAPMEGPNAPLEGPYALPVARPPIAHAL